MPIQMPKSLPTIMESVETLNDPPSVEVIDLPVTDEALVVRDYRQAIEPILIPTVKPVTDAIYAGVILTAILAFLIAVNT